MTTITGTTARAPAVGWLAAGWAFTYGFVALIWTASGEGWPFVDAGLSPMALLDPRVGAPLFAQVLLGAAVAAVAMSGSYMERLDGGPRVALLAFSWTVAGLLVLVVPGLDLLVLTGYAPMLLTGAVSGTVFTPVLFHELWCAVGGILLGFTTLSWQRRIRAACVDCGRGGGDRVRWDRWIRPAVRVAVAVPLMYALSRLAWVVHVPLGVSREQLAAMHADGGVWRGAGLAAFAVVGAVLTVGLVRPWGETFPRWMVGLAGRRVPVALAVVPAMYVAAIVFAGGIALGTSPQMWADGGPLVVTHLLWPVWGVALAVAAYAYRQRRRGACRRCGEDSL